LQDQPNPAHCEKAMPKMSSIAPAKSELLEVFHEKYGPPDKLGWGPKMRLDSGYFTPDDCYEALVSKLVFDGCNWADVGCGRDTFPTNWPLARRLCKRAGFVLGVDPDPNIQEHPLLHERFQGLIEDYEPSRSYDLVTLRMVAEHIAQPDDAIRKISELLKPGGLAVIYTPYRWSPMSIAAAIVPFRFHNGLKRILWNTEERDTFPTCYELNTRADLEKHTAAHSLRQVYFEYIDDCRITASYKLLQRMELALRRVLHACRISYPEKCILAVFEKAP